MCEFQESNCNGFGDRGPMWWTDKCTYFSSILGGCPFHGRVERDEIPTRESPPKQSGTR